MVIVRQMYIVLLQLPHTQHPVSVKTGRLAILFSATTEAISVLTLLGNIEIFTCTMLM